MAWWEGGHAGGHCHPHHRPHRHCHRHCYHRLGGRESRLEVIVIVVFMLLDINITLSLIAIVILLLDISITLFLIVIVVHLISNHPYHNFSNQVFIYPDMKTAISGTFSGNGRLVEGRQCEVVPRNSLKI